LKPGLLERIDREIKLHSADSPGLIQFKMNALEDKDIARALYRASQAGVKVDLVVRDTCRVRPGIPGLSEHISVVSIVGRFLEHCRIFHFRNSGMDEYFIGSADAMMRNLESRVETVVPVEHPELKEKLQEVLDVQLGDQRSAWDMKSDGTYVQRTPTTEKEKRGSQDTFILLAEKRQKLAAQHKKRKVKVRSVARRKAK
jgi:polyphosphate kinase